jgi:hypothetical protein
MYGSCLLKASSELYLQPPEPKPEVDEAAKAKEKVFLSLPCLYFYLFICRSIVNVAQEAARQQEMQAQLKALMKISIALGKVTSPLLFFEWRLSELSSPPHPPPPLQE